MKEAPAHLALIADSNPLKLDDAGQAKLPVSPAALLNPTIRLLRFGHLYNERTNSMIRMSDALQSP